MIMEIRETICYMPGAFMEDSSQSIVLKFLGPRGPLVLPLVGPVPSRPSRAKNLDHLYTGIYAL